MAKSLTDIVNSMFGRTKPVTPSLHKTISSRNYKKMLKCISEDVPSVSSSYVDLYKDQNEKYVIHIKDETLSNVLYQKLNADVEALGTIPKEFEIMKFVTVKNEVGVVFVECDDITSYESKIEQLYILSNFKNLVSWFCDNLSTDENKLYVDYNKFFHNFIGKRGFLASLMLSITLQEYNFNIEELKAVINELLYFCCEYPFFKFEDLKSSIEKANTQFYEKIKSGIYIKDLEPRDLSTRYSFSDLPVYLYVNMFRVAINEKCFSDLNEFFDSSKIEELEKQLDKEEFVFDEEAFKTQLKKTNETEIFVQYRTTGQTVFDRQGIYLKVKDTTQIANIKSTLSDLNERCFLTCVEFFNSLQSDTCYIHYSVNATKNIPLSAFIKIGIDSDDKKLAELIWNIYTTFASNSDIKKKVFFAKDARLIDVLAYNEGKFVFADITAMNFQARTNKIGFEYPLLIMQVIEEFLNHNQITRDDIYKCKFMQMLSPDFADALFDYIDTKSYTPSGMIKKVKNTLDAEYVDKVEFLENIPLDGSELICRTTFIDKAKTNEMVQALLVNRDESYKARKLVGQLGYVSLDDRTAVAIGGEELQLSEKNLRKLFYNFKFTNLADFLIPSKVIVSRDFTSGGTYQIIGIIWNKFDLYSLSSRIKTKATNVFTMYKVIYNLMELYNTYGYYIFNSDVDFDAVLVGNGFNVVFDLSRFENTGDIFVKGTRNLEEYYDNLLSALSAKYGKTLSDFPCFSYGQIVEDHLNLSNERQLWNLREAIYSGIKKCESHGKWYLGHNMCPVCQKIYLINDEPVNYKLYEDKVVQFFESEEDEEYVFALPPFKARKDMFEQTKLALENDLYRNFECGLVPEKLVITNYTGDSLDNVRAIAYNDYNFENVLPLEMFKETQRLKVVLVMYKKVLPYILDKSFISTDENIFTTMFMARNMKGEIIIPNITLLDSKTILSSDENLKADRQEETKKVFSKFLYEYINSDTVLSVELGKGNPLLTQIVEDIKNCSFSEECIREYLASKDSYCSVHGIHYSSKDVICPECIKNGITKDDVKLYSNEYFDSLAEKSPKYEGGEANLYSYLDNQVQKLFNKRVNIGFKSKIIGKALEKAKLLEQFNREHDDVKFVTINKVLYSYENNILSLRGYTEDLIEGSFKISSLKDQSFVAKMGYKRKDVVEILIKACKGINFLHSIGGFIGDLNGGNIVIKDNVVYIIDIDGMSFDDVRNCVCTDMYIYPPSAESKNITADDDWYSFAIQAFYYLTYSHPFKGVCDSKRIPNNEMQRMKLGFSVLGEHGISVPTISIGWDFMPQYLIKFFLETFEGKRRESMLGVLRDFLQYIDKNTLKFKKIERARGVLTSITENLYVDVNNNLIFKEEEKLSLDESAEIAICNNDLIVTTDKVTYVVSDETGNVDVFNKVYGSKILRVTNGKIYYTSNDKKTLFVDELNQSTNEISTHIIKRATENPVLSLFVCGEDKFILVEDNEYEDAFDIYCNTINVKKIPKNQFSGGIATSISYDEVFERWLVLFECADGAQGIVINKSEGKECISFNLHETVSSSICFYANVLFYVGHNKIFYYNVANGKLKELECDMVNVDSRIRRVGDKFVINNKKEAYMYFKS